MRSPRAVLLAFAVLAAFAPAAQADAPVPPSVQAAIDEITGKPVYAHSIWGYQLSDASTGEVLLSSNADRMFVTGSILKIYATSTALDALGPKYRFRTPVFRRGSVKGGTLEGDLVLVASGDYSFGLRERKDGTLGFNSAPEIDHNYADTGLPGPTLLKGSDPLAGVDDLARQVRAAGVRRVSGDVAIDDRLFNTFDGWPDGLMAPIWVNENVIDINSIPTSAGKPAKVEWRPKSAAIRVVSKVKTVKGDGGPLTVRTVRPGLVEVAGNLSAKSKPILNISHIPDPASFARTVFIEALERAGVQVDATATGRNPRSLLPGSRSYPRSSRVAERVSPVLSEYTKAILKVSYNRGADDMVCIVAAAKGRRDCVDGLTTELATIKRFGVSPTTTKLFDGAGSSEFDRSTPQDYATFLRRIQSAPWGSALHDGLPILGVDGTFATNQKGTPAAGNVFIKSGTRIQGTPNDAQAIASAITQAGYINAKSGRKLTYALFLRDLSLSPDLKEFFAADEDQGKLAAAFQQGY
jgi:D-alanyl-D-alanine carboxypeptidase/D-alanyl-D-alanine-endopeptidase (penicillin-binding protein 4)